MEVVLSGFEILMRWDVIVALLVGSVGGVSIGAIPGVGPAVAIAILLPATFSLDPIVGLAVLLGFYGSSMYGGAIPAILINTPGTAVNALTTYDGYPMTMKGEGRRALSLAYSASFFGGIFSVVCLMLLSPVLALVAPMFGAREIFLSALLGIILVVTAHRGQVMAAGMLASFGIFIGTIGLEPIKYTKRFTFDQSWPASGVKLIVVVLGLFAISQAIMLLVDRDESPKAVAVKGGLFQGLRELMRHKRVAGVSASFGVYSLRNSVTDCANAAVFGILGFILKRLKRLNLLIVPIIPGMVLGGIMEVKLRISMARVKTPFDFIDRPIAFILFLIILLVLGLYLRSVWKYHQARKEALCLSKTTSTSFGQRMYSRRASSLKARGLKGTEKKP